MPKKKTKTKSKFSFSSIDPESIVWRVSSSAYEEVVTKVNAMKINDAICVQGIEKSYVPNAIRAKVYKLNPGDYIIRTKFNPVKKSAFFLKTAR